MSVSCAYCNREFKSARSLQVHLQGCRAYLGESRYAEYCKQRSHKKTESQKAEISARYTGAGNPFYGKKHTDSTKQKISDAESGYIWINDGNVEYQIKPADLKDYPSFHRGRILENTGFRDFTSMGGKIWITNQLEELPIDPDKLDAYLALGYVRGRSDSTKQKASDTRIQHIYDGSYRMPNNGIKSCKSYLNGKLLKSSYEFIYAVWLEDHEIDYEYEPFRLKLATGRNYTPDFLLKESSTIVEVKGREDEATMNKLRLCRGSVESADYSYVVLHGQSIWNKYYPDLVRSGYNIDESLELLYSRTKSQKVDRTIPYPSWIIDNKSKLIKEVSNYGTDIQ